jgi:hypothetical protein
MNEFLKFVLCCIITSSSSTTVQLALKKRGHKERRQEAILYSFTFATYPEQQQQID